MQKIFPRDDISKVKNFNLSDCEILLERRCGKQKADLAFLLMKNL